MITRKRFSSFQFQFIARHCFAALFGAALLSCAQLCVAAVAYWDYYVGGTRTNRTYIVSATSATQARAICESIARSSRPNFNTPQTYIDYLVDIECSKVGNATSGRIEHMYLYCPSFETQPYYSCLPKYGLGQGWIYGSMEYALCQEGTFPRVVVDSHGARIPPGQVVCQSLDIQAANRSDCESCDVVGSSLLPSTGAISHSIDLGLPLEEESAMIIYDSSDRLPGNPQIPPSYVVQQEVSFLGPLWKSRLQRRIYPTAGNTSSDISVKVDRGDGRLLAFDGKVPAVGQSVVLRSRSDTIDQLTAIRQNTFDIAFSYRDRTKDVVELYDPKGKLITVFNATRILARFNYTSIVAAQKEYLSEVVDTFGRRISLSYSSTIGPSGIPLLNKIVDPSRFEYSLQYDGAGNVSSIVFPDLSKKAFVYDHPSFNWAMTGVVDESGAVTRSYSYDGMGRAIASNQPDGADSFAVSYGTPPSLTTVLQGTQRALQWNAPSGVSVQRSGQASSLAVSIVNGSPRVSSLTQPAGSGSEAASKTFKFDSQGRITQTDDYVGNRTCLVYETARPYPVQVIEGVHPGVECDSPVTPQGGRTTSIQWHPDWKLESKKAEPGRIITFVYNAQPNPFDHNRPAHCAPESAVLPDGKPIAVLCQRVEQATTDATGGASFEATLQPSIPPRVSTWTYNNYGQTISANGPRDDVNDTTTFTYYGESIFAGPDPGAVGYAVGDLASRIDALGNVTTYTKYNRLGQNLETIDPNGIVTTFTYDARQRVTSITTAGHRTLYTYWPNGLLRSVVFPDETFVVYQYDRAHRLLAVEDNLKNRIEYTLDGMGNRKIERVMDASYTLRKTLTREIDALGRVQKASGRNLP